MIDFYSVFGMITFPMMNNYSTNTNKLNSYSLTYHSEKYQQLYLEVIVQNDFKTYLVLETD